MTGVVPNQNTAVELDFTLTAVGYNQTLFCSRTSWDDSYADSLTCFVIDTKARYNFSITGTDVEDVYVAVTRYVLKSFGNTAKLRLHDDPLTEWTLIGGGSDSSTFTSKETVLFMSGDPSSNPVDNAGSWKLHSFKMRDGENGRLLADYVPAMKGSTAGVLDRVSGTFKTSGNTSYPFIAGSVTGAYERVKVHVGNSAAVKFLDFDILRAGNGYFRFAVSDVWVPDGESSVTLYFATGVDADHLGEYRELAAGVTAASAITNTVEVSTGFDDVFCSVKVVHGSGEYLVGRTVSFESVVAVTALDNVARTATLAFLPTNAARQIRFYHGAQDFGDDIAQWVEAGVFASFAVPANATSLTVDLPAEWGTTSLYGRFVMNYVYDLPVDALLDWIRPNRASYNNSSYLRTGVTPNQDTAVEIDFTSVDDSFVQAMFCARTSMSSADRIVCFMTSGPLAFGYQFNDAVADSVNISVNTRYVMKTYKNSGAIYEQSDLSTPYQEFSNAGSTSATFSAPEMVLFMSGTPSSSPVDNAGSWKLHGFKLRDGENGPLLVDFVPAMKNGVAGVLDLVSETFRGSGNSRTFLAGNVVDDNPQRAVPTGDSETVVMREPHVACDVTLDGQSGFVEVSCTILAAGVGQSVADVYLVYSLNGEVTTVKMLEQSAVGSETVYTIAGLSSADTIGCEVVVSNALYGSSVSLLPEYRFDVHQGAVAIIARDDDARTATVSFLPTNVVRELRFYYGDHDYGGDLELWSQRSAWTNYTVVAGADSLSVEFPSGWGSASPFGRFVMNDVYDLPIDALLDWIRPNRYSYNNSSYLRTGVTPNQDTAVEIDFTSVDDSFVQAMFCARTAQNSTDRIVCFMTGGPLAFGYQFNDAVADSVNISVNTRYVMKTYKNSGAIYEQSDLSTPYQEFSNAGSTTATFTAPEMVLFMSGTPSSSPVDNAGSWKLHGFKLRDGENGPLLVDFVPAMKNGVAGVCDLVNGTFRGSGNSCAFLAGNVVDENPKKRVPSASSATIQPKEPTASVTMSVNSQTESLDFVCEIVSAGEGKSAVDAYIVYSIDGAMNTVQLADQVAAGARCQYSIAGLSSAATVDCRLIVSNDTYGCVAFSLPPTRFDAYTFAIAKILADPSLRFGAISAPTCKSVFAEFGIADQITGAVTDAGATSARLYYSTDSNVVDRYEGSFIELDLVGGVYSNETAALPKSTKLYVRTISLNGDAVAVSPIVEYTTSLKPFVEDPVACDSDSMQHYIIGNRDIYVFSNVLQSASLTLRRPTVEASLLVVGGGGGGGGTVGGGGGGGGVIYVAKTNLLAGSYAVSVGAGGAGVSPATAYNTSNGGAGGSSSFGSIVAYGGGGGGGFTKALATGNFGSAGGLSGSQTSFSFVDGSHYKSSQMGHIGGLGYKITYGDAGGGGGGAGGNGTTPTSKTHAGAGGAGFVCRISGFKETYGSGGGGGSRGAGNQGGVGGVHAGTGGRYTVASSEGRVRGTSGDAGFGGGGGGSAYPDTVNDDTGGGAGGCGTVILSAVFETDSPVAVASAVVDESNGSLDFSCTIEALGFRQKSVDVYLAYSVNGVSNSVKFAEGAVVGDTVGHSLAGLTSADTVGYELIVSNAVRGITALKAAESQFDVYALTAARMVAGGEEFGENVSPVCRGVAEDAMLVDLVTGRVDSASSGARLYYSTDSNTVDRLGGDWIELPLEADGRYSHVTSVLPSATALYLRVISRGDDSLSISPVIAYKSTDHTLILGTGGSAFQVTDGSGDVVHVFTNTAEAVMFVSPASSPIDLRYLVVGGGAGGRNGTGGNPSYGGAGGNGGAVVTNTVHIRSYQTFQISVGAGGKQTSTVKGANGPAGAASSLAGAGIEVIAAGGAENSARNSGGSGAGGAASGYTGGAGVYSDITGESVVYSGGGGGGSVNSSTVYYGGGAGGRGGCNSWNSMTSGERGGGGGGGDNGGKYLPAGSGGDGMVILRYHPPAATIAAHVDLTEVQARFLKIRIEPTFITDGEETLDIYTSLRRTSPSEPFSHTLLASGVHPCEVLEKIYTTLVPNSEYEYSVLLSNSVRGVEYKGTLTTLADGLPAQGGERRFLSDGSYVHVFETVGDHVLAMPTPFSGKIEYMVVGGGGAGRNGRYGNPSAGYGAGSAGAVVSGKVEVVESGLSFAITIGDGGVASSANNGSGTAGSASSLVLPDTTVTASGGAAGTTSQVGGAGAGGAASGTTGGVGIYSTLNGYTAPEDTYFAWGGNSGTYGGTAVRKSGTNGRGAGGDGGNSLVATFKAGDGGCGCVIIRYVPTGGFPEGPFGELNSLTLNESGEVVVGYDAFWAGNGCDYLAATAIVWQVGSNVTNEYELSTAAIGKCTAAIALPMETAYGFRVRFVSAAGVYETGVMTTTLPALTEPVSFEPVVDRQAMTVRFTGSVTNLGFGTTTLSVEYGGTTELGHSLELGSADEADGSLAFSSDPIACYHRIRSQRMKHVYYRYVYVITAGDRELMRAASEIRRVLVCNLPTIFYVK